MVAILEKALLGAGECEAVFVGVLAGDAVRLGGASPVFLRWVLPFASEVVPREWSVSSTQKARASPRSSKAKR